LRCIGVMRILDDGAAVSDAAWLNERSRYTAARAAAGDCALRQADFRSVWWALDRSNAPVFLLVSE
jgi:hypothetical protein